MGGSASVPRDEKPSATEPAMRTNIDRRNDEPCDAPIRPLSKMWTPPPTSVDDCETSRRTSVTFIPTVFVAVNEKEQSSSMPGMPGGNSVNSNATPNGSFTIAVQERPLLREGVPFSLQQAKRQH